MVFEFPKVISRLLKWFWRRKYFFILLFTINFFIWMFCLPERLFYEPTCTVLKDNTGAILGARIADDGQ